MSASDLIRPTGTARKLLAAGWVVDLGGAIPTWAPDREAALDLLDPVGRAEIPNDQPQ